MIIDPPQFITTPKPLETDLSKLWPRYLSEHGPMKAMQDPGPNRREPGEDVATPSRFAAWLARTTGVAGWRVELVGCEFRLREPFGYVIERDEGGVPRLFEIEKIGVDARKVATGEPER